MESITIIELLYLENLNDLKKRLTSTTKLLKVTQQVASKTIVITSTKLNSIKELHLENASNFKNRFKC